jgi:hypothetical protein
VPTSSRILEQAHHHPVEIERGSELGTEHRLCWARMHDASIPVSQ